MIHNLRLNPAPFAMIAQGIKTIELRLYDEKRQLINVDDEIIFTNTEDGAKQIRAKVLALHKFSSFEELYANLPLLKCGYTDADIHTASPKDMEEYYSRDKQKKYGVVGIEIEEMNILKVRHYVKLES